MSEFPDIPGLQIRSELGRGGMAQVFVAVQTVLEREVAVKLVRPRNEADLMQLQRLENEARALAGLQHPHIVELYDFGRTAEGGMYYVMPLLPGGDLRRWGAPVDEERVAGLLHQLLDALAHAHAAGIVHRDIKPENILFDRNDRPLLADFGAALTRSKSRITSEGLAIGSAGYMSPEQARGIDVDARSDLYSLGVLAFELLTAKLPFDGPDALAIAMAQMENPVPKLPPALVHWQGFFDRALAYEPAWRFASAEEMQAALDDIEAGPEPARDLPDPRKLGLALAIAVAVVLGLLVWLTREPPVDADEITGLIAAGQLLPPRAPNALDALLDARQQGLDPLLIEAAQDRLLSALQAEQDPLLAASRLDQLPPLWERWQLAVGALDAHADLRVVEHNRRVESLLQPQLERALREFDRREAALALRLLDASAMVSKPLLELASQVRALPVEGEPFSDPGGPPLVLLERPQSGRAGYALMQAPVNDALFQAFSESSGAKGCASPEPGRPGCLSHAEAGAFARWLAQRTGQPYRLPSRSELKAGVGQLANLPLHAWSSECRMLAEQAKDNAAKRAWGRVKSIFGARPAPPQTHCVGHWALSLDGSGQWRAYEQSAPTTTVLLLREVPPVADSD
ncbi:bifunctional serine/threonine-protein kinase/formylglycine-generating enzyme family protein [Pseudomarimonas salicorniae]|uniref:Bifunctional serine/threonine-protein kinase/formylglycine-generating enzyme family protein n=1 Tax=Pseudomarimonas salicorniae TaxID=2933270 RepID=A0ABT0GF44_9GAMM|nr:bifunctional serine/threonine-protein kinase/formylglycine-generating enzyme family protein [Lysobacter sp. CAU 1642]MCK7593164.1 bifunctional serine/threonine-protein kinase/formylglycine-generating enzyme family protein [Lysobacter sp. CAU 1642]